MQRPGSLMLEPRMASQTQDESHTRPNLGKGRAGCVVPDVTPGRTLTQHNPVSNGGVVLSEGTFRQHHLPINSVVGMPSAEATVTQRIVGLSPTFSL